MRYANLALLLEELQAVLEARGCRVTELSITVHPPLEKEEKRANRRCCGSDDVISLHSTADAGQSG